MFHDLPNQTDMVCHHTSPPFQAALRRTDVTQQRHYAALQEDDLRIRQLQHGIREANLYKSNATSVGPPDRSRSAHASSMAALRLHTAPPTADVEP